MIRDPSDGSVKPSTKSAPTVSVPQHAEQLPKREPAAVGADTPSRSNNWGLTSLTQKPKASTFKPMDGEELKEHYATHTLGRKPKEKRDV